MRPMASPSTVPTTIPRNSNSATSANERLARDAKRASSYWLYRIQGPALRRQALFNLKPELELGAVQAQDQGGVLARPAAEALHHVLATDAVGQKPGFAATATHDQHGFRIIRARRVAGAYHVDAESLQGSGRVVGHAGQAASILHREPERAGAAVAVGLAHEQTEAHRRRAQTQDSHRQSHRELLFPP